MKRFVITALLLFHVLMCNAQFGEYIPSTTWSLDLLHSSAPGLRCDSIMPCAYQGSSVYERSHITAANETDSTLNFKVSVNIGEDDIADISFSYRLDADGVLRVKADGSGRIVQGPVWYCAVAYFSKIDVPRTAVIKGVGFEGDTAYVSPRAKPLRFLKP